MARGPRIWSRMTQFPLPDKPRLLVIGTGDMKDRFLSLVSGCEVESTTLVPELEIADLRSFTAITLISERPLPSFEAPLDEACWRSGIPWTSGLLLAQQFRIGPTIVPGRTPCHECWRRRVRSQAPDLAVHDAIQNLGMERVQSPWFSGSLPALQDQVAALLAAEVMSLVSNSYPFPSDRLGRYWQGDAIYGYLQAHRFAYIGTCTRCVAVEIKQAGSRALRGFAHDRFAAPLTAGTDLEK
jgi:bacteriocin biosynthesis cyclodehydratase domain-containing protein